VLQGCGAQRGEQAGDVILQSSSPEVEEELAPIRKAIAALRGVAANHRPSEPLEPSNPAVLAMAEAHDQAMKELAPLGFNSLGDVGDRHSDGSIAVSRWFAHSDGTICGWLGFATTKHGPQLLVLLITEASGPAYCSSQRGGSALSLARPPHFSHAHHETSANLADIVRGHRERASSLTAGMRVTEVSTLGEGLEVMERLLQNRAAWRASIDEQELLRADLIAVLGKEYRRLRANDFWLSYGNAAKWLDFQPAHPTRPGAGGSRATPSSGAFGGYVTAPGPLADLLASTLTGPEAEEGTPGIESDWLFHCELELRGTRLQMLDVFMAGNDDEGVILETSAGVYVVEARVITYGIDRRISRVRVYPKGQVVAQGKLAGEVGVDLAAVAICDVDRLAGWARSHQDEWQRWGDKLWFGRATRAGVYTCEPARTVVPFVDSGFGDGTYPVYYLMHDGRPVGLEAEFLSPGTPYF
jgi:hypothetical protein